MLDKCESKLSKNSKWFSSNWEVIVQTIRNLHICALVCEQCIQRLYRNVVLFLFQACVAIFFVHAKFHKVLGPFTFYLILFHMTIEFKSKMMHTNI
jgi:hypothetical protein